MEPPPPPPPAHFSFLARTFNRAKNAAGSMLTGHRVQERKTGSAISPPTVSAPPPAPLLAPPTSVLDLTPYTQNDFASLTKQQMLHMTPAERAALVVELHTARTRLEKDSGQPPDVLQRVINLQNLLSNIRQEARNRRLFDIIENVESDPNLSVLSSALCLTNESVIPSKSLFRAIWKRISSNTEYSLPQLQGALHFCINWLTHNQKTPLLAKVSKQFARIVAKTESHPEDSIQNLAKEIKNKLSVAPATLSEPRAKPKANFAFQTILEDYLALKIPPNMEAIAEDFLFFHWQLIQDIDHDHLVKKKWEARPAPVQRLIDFFNKCSDFIVQRIQSEQNQQRKVRIVEFFLRLADSCEMRCDFATSFMILSALNRHEVGRLAETSLELPLREIFTRLTTLFDSHRNFPNLRAKLKTVAGSFHIPYQGILQKDLTGTDENVPGQESICGEIYCSEYKITLIQDLITHFLAVKSMPFPASGRTPDLFHTDLPFLIEETKLTPDPVPS